MHFIFKRQPILSIQFLIRSQDYIVNANTHSWRWIVHFHFLGDGRMDSPGHCAQYCSYTFMEYTSKKILCITTMDKRSTDRKSTNLEKACFMKGMQFFKDKGIKVVEVVTDAHVQIASVMSKKNFIFFKSNLFLNSPKLRLIRQGGKTICCICTCWSKKKYVHLAFMWSKSFG